MTPPPSPAPPAIACPTDWVQGATTAKCYRKVAGAFTHKECAVQCGEGSLVCIGSQAENDLLFNELFTIDGISWIGLYQESASADSTDGWTWSNGCASTYENWYSGSPNDSCGPGSQSCALVGARTSPTWADGNCGNRGACICEYPASTTSAYSEKIDGLVYHGFCWAPFQIISQLILPLSVVLGTAFGCFFCSCCPLYKWRKRDSIASARA